MTQKLFYEDTYLRRFTANIKHIDCLPDGNYAVVLDRTAFYPAGGGQPSDTGQIDGKPVLAVSYNGEKIMHILAEAPGGKQVEGVIDWQRRFDHMQQHSGQHILSAACVSVLGADTIGFHLGAMSCQIDLNIDTLTASQVQSIETTANSIIFANRPVHQHIAAAADLANFPLRKLPTKTFNRIRLVEIDQFDCCPCGGTHVASTGEVGLVKIRNWERRQNLMRIDFVAGFRALTDYAAKNTAVHTIAIRLSASPQTVVAAVDNTLAKLETVNQQLLLAKRELNHQLSQQLLDRAMIVKDVKLVVDIRENVTPTQINDLAQCVLVTPKTISLLAGINTEQTRAHLVFGRTADINLDMNRQLQTLFRNITGRGGGNAQKAQGGTTNLAVLSSALNQAVQEIIALL